MAKATKKNTKKFLAFGLIAVLIIFLAYAMMPYIKAVFGAIIFYVIFQPVYNWLVKKGLSKNMSAVTVIILSILVILLPLLLIISLLVGEIGTVMQGAEGLIGNLDNIDDMLKNINISEIANESLEKIGGLVRNLLVSGVSAATSLLISLTIMYFLFYFMLVNNKTVAEKTRAIIPFNKKNTERLMKEAKNVSNSVILSSGLIALTQGVMVTVGFWAVGIPGALLWGVIAGFLSILPAVGSPLIWGPAVAVLFVQGSYVSAVGLLIWGIIIMNIDNVMRPMIQKRVGEMHPLISLIGVFIGLPIFGILGLIIGPLLLSYMVLTIQMFKEEYL